MDILSITWLLFLYLCITAITLLILVSKSYSYFSVFSHWPDYNYIYFQFLIITYVVTKPYPIVERYEEEETYQDHKTKTKVKFPTIRDPYEVNLSVVVPAYNEERRCEYFKGKNLIAHQNSSNPKTFRQPVSMIKSSQNSFKVQ